MSNAKPSCALGLSRQILSAWRDEQLSEADMRRIAQHVPDCPGCRTRLAQFARIAAAVQQQPTPDLRAQTWRGIQERLIGGARHPRRFPRAALNGFAAVIVLAVAAVVLTLVFNLRAHGPGPSTPATSVPIFTSTPAPTTTPVPTSTPVAFAVTSVDLAVSPSDITGTACGTSVTFTYTATFHIPANTAGGTIQFM